MRNKYKHYSSWKNTFYTNMPELDKKKLRKEIKDATTEYLKTNKIKRLPSNPNIKPKTVYVKTLREISDTEEFAYLEENYENKFY
jgi:hypothetical protein